LDYLRLKTNSPMLKSELISKLQSWAKTPTTILVGSAPLLNTDKELAVDIYKQGGEFMFPEHEVINEQLCTVYHQLNTRMSASGLKYIAYIKKMEEQGISIPFSFGQKEDNRSSSLTLGSLIDDALTSNGHSLSLLKFIPVELKQAYDNVGLTSTEKQIAAHIVDAPDDLTAIKLYCNAYNNADTRKLKEADYHNSLKQYNLVLDKVNAIREAAKPLADIIKWKQQNVGPDDILLDEMAEISNPVMAHNIVVNAFNKVKDTGILEPKPDIFVFSQAVILWQFDIANNSWAADEHSPADKLLNMKSMLDRLEFHFFGQSLNKVVIRDWKTSADFTANFIQGNYKKYQIHHQLAFYVLAVKWLLKSLGYSYEDIQDVEFQCVIDYIPYNPSGDLVGYKSYTLSFTDIYKATYGGYYKPSYLSMFEDNQDKRVQVYFSEVAENYLPDALNPSGTGATDNKIVGIIELLNYYYQLCNLNSQKKNKNN